MKNALAIILSVFLIIALTGSGYSEPSSSEQVSSPAKIGQNVQQLSAKAAEFQIHYAEWIVPGQENIYDTFEGYIQKDLITAGKATDHFVPTDENLQKIYDKVTELDLLSIDREMTSDVLTTTDEIIGQEPCTKYEIELSINGKTYLITGDDTAWFYIDTNQDAANFWSFRCFLHDMLWNSEEFRSLPEAVGGYD